MKLLLLLISIILSIKCISGDLFEGYGIWNEDNNSIVIGKLNLNSYSKMFILENSTLINSNDNPLSTYNKEKNTIYFFSNNINNPNSGYLYSYSFDSDELKLVVEYSKSKYQFFAIESDHSSTDLDLFVVYKDSSYKTDNYYCGALSQLYGVPALYDPIDGEFLSASYNTKKETFDVLALTKDNRLQVSSYILFGINVNRQQLKSTNFNIDSPRSTSLLTYSQYDSSNYAIMMNKGIKQLVKINAGNIILLNWMNESQSILVYSSMKVQPSGVFQSVIYNNNSFGVVLLNSNGMVESAQTPFLINNFWFI